MEKNAAKENKGRKMTGTVVRRSGDKTVAVAVKRVTVHPLYQKRRTETAVYLAHDEKNEAGVGDEVVIAESRPLSARKRWRIAERRAGSAPVADVIDEIEA